VSHKIEYPLKGKSDDELIRGFEINPRLLRGVGVRKLANGFYQVISQISSWKVDLFHNEARCSNDETVVAIDWSQSDIKRFPFLIAELDKKRIMDGALGEKMTEYEFSEFIRFQMEASVIWEEKSKQRNVFLEMMDKAFDGLKKSLTPREWTDLKKAVEQKCKGMGIHPISLISNKEQPKRKKEPLGNWICISHHKAHCPCVSAAAALEFAYSSKELSEKTAQEIKKRVIAVFREGKYLIPNDIDEAFLSGY